jgi:hypothetical protein
MTATHDRRSDPRARTNALEEWGGRSVFGTAKGWPWWAAVVLALGLSIVGAFIDMHTSGSLGKVFEGGYVLGCVGAVCLVRRRNLFGPMVQPPLILAVTVPVVVLLTKGLPSGSGMASKLLALGVPLVTGFPTMAATTGATVVIGGIRFLVQRKPIDDGTDDWDDGNREARRRPADKDKERERGERSGSAARPRTASSGRTGRPLAGRTSRDDRSSSRERADRADRASSSGRSEPAGREGRSASGRSASDRTRERGSQSADRDSGRARRPSSERGRSGEAGDRGRARDDGERRQPPRSGQSRDRGQAPRSGRPSREDGRSQPPRRRDDDY